MIRSPHQPGSEISEEDPAALPGVINNLQFRYYDGRQWTDEWDSLREGRLPTAVEIAAWYGQPEDGTDGDGFDSAFGSEDSDDLQSGTDSLPSELESVPDRRRVILIPDAGEAEESSTSPDQLSFDGGLDS